MTLSLALTATACVVLALGGVAWLFTESYWGSRNLSSRAWEYVPAGFFSAATLLFAASILVWVWGSL